MQLGNNPQPTVKWRQSNGLKKVTKKHQPKKKEKEKINQETGIGSKIGR